MTGYQNIGNVERAYPVSRGSAAIKKNTRCLYDRIIDFFCIIVMWLERPVIRYLAAGLTAAGVGVTLFFVLSGLIGGTMSAVTAVLVGIATVFAASSIFNWAE